MGRVAVFFFALVCLSLPVRAAEVSWQPRIISLPAETYDWLAVVTWELPTGQPRSELEILQYRVEAAFDPGFLELASSSAWLRWDAWSFILSPLPKGEIFVRVGSRRLAGEENVWSETRITEQMGPMFPYSRPSPPEPTLSPSPLPSPLPSPSPSVQSRPIRPVIFIHGFNGQPSDWKNKATNRDYVGLLLDQGFSPELIGLYPYADYNRDGVYDWQGEIRGIAQDLPRVVEDLSEEYRQRGGDGRVDLVGFSLGGLVARAYLASPEFDHRVRRLIDIGSPHQGVFWGNVANRIDNLPFKGPEIRKAFLGLASQVWNRLARETGRPVDLNSPAAQEVIPGSQFLKDLNRVEKTPQSLDYYCLYGDIHATLNRKLFHWTLRSRKFSLGDLLMTPESATAIPGGLCQGFGFIDENDFEVKVIRGQLTPFLEIVAPLESLRFWHGNLVKQKEVKNQVLELLR